MSINSILSTARSALFAQQAAIETASHNISNANVEGYTRQRLDMQANTPQQTPWGPVGRGVSVTGITRIRDAILDGVYRGHAAQAEGYDTRSTLLGRISDVFNEPSDGAFASRLDEFWNAWSNLANNPNNVAAKSVVQQRGAEVANTLNRYANELDSVVATSAQQLQQQVTDLNRYADQVADLNRQIVAVESGNRTASDLRDTRDRLIDQMNAIAPVKVIEQPNGSVNVYIANATVVDGVAAKHFTAPVNAGIVSVQLAGQNIVPLRAIGGAMGAMIDVMNTDIPTIKQQLDDFAKQLVASVNTIHRTGWTAAGDALGGANWDASAPPTGSNVNFFDPAAITAKDIKLSTQVASDAAYIAAGNVQDATGNNAIANQLAQFRTDTSTILKYGSTTETTAFGEFYHDIVTRLGVATNDANASATVYATLSQQADSRRLSVAGVATDEELISITKHQQAYAAAARVVTTADEMSKMLLDMVR